MRIYTAQYTHIYFLATLAKRTYKRLTPAMSTASIKILVSVEISKDQPNENWQRLFTESVLGSQAHHLHFGTDSKAGIGAAKLYMRKKGKLQLYPDWRLLSWGSYM